MWRDGLITQIRCKSDFPMSFFFQWRGFSHNVEVMDAQVTKTTALLLIRVNRLLMAPVWSEDW